MSGVGYVVIQYNQASHQPDVWSDLLDSLHEAREIAAEATEQTKEIGRREWYAVAEVTLIEDDEVTP